MSDEKKAAPSEAPASGSQGEGAGGAEGGAVKPIVRRRVAKSAATAERPTFQDVPEAAPPASAAREGEGGGGGGGDFALPAASVGDAAAAVGGAAASGDASSRPASTPRPDSRGTGRSADGRWDMRAPPRSGPRPGFRGAPRGDEGGFRRPGASGGRAMPFIPERDAEGNPIGERPRFRSDPAGGPAGDRPAGDRPAGDRPDRGPRPPRGPRPDGARGPRPPRADGPRAEGGAEGPRPERRERRDDRPARSDGDRDARPRGERPAQREAAPPPSVPARKVPTVAETILLGLPKAKLDAQTAKEAQKPKTAKEALRAKTLGREVAPAKPKEAAPVAVELQAEWIAAGASGAKAAVDAAGGAAEKLVEAWIKSQNAEALVEVEALTDVAGPVRKAAKRGVFALKSKGVAIPERKSAAAAPKASDADAWEATFLPPDGRGSVAFTIAKKLSDGRLQVAEVIAREPQGVVQAASAWLSRTQLREGHQRAQSRAGIAPVAVPVAWARKRIAEALKLNGTSGTLLPLGLDRCRELIEPAPEAAEHPISALEATLAEGAAPAAAALHNEPEFRGWLPDAPAIDEMLRKLGESLGEGGAKDPEKVSKGLDEEVKNATDRYFSPEVRGVVASRLRDAALSVRARAGEEKAKEVVATARAVEQAGLITSPPRDVAFLSAFFQKAVALLLQKGSGSLRIPMAQSPSAG
jgi:hypothetical protein